MTEQEKTTLPAAKPAPPPAARPARQAQPPTYTISEYVLNSAAFDAPPDVVRAALRRAGKQAYTKDEARHLIAAFQRKEVKP